MSLLSSNPEEREATLRALVRRLLAEHNVTDTEAARQLGRPRQLLEKQLRESELCYLRLSDLPTLERLVPGLAGALVASLGLRVAPEAAPGAAVDVLTALGSAMNALSKVTSETVAALEDGIDSAEAARIRKACERLRREAGVIEASVQSAVVVR